MLILPGDSVEGVVIVTVLLVIVPLPLKAVITELEQPHPLKRTVTLLDEELMIVPQVADQLVAAEQATVSV